MSVKLDKWYEGISQTCPRDNNVETSVFKISRGTAFCNGKLVAAQYEEAVWRCSKCGLTKEWKSTIPNYNLEKKITV